MAKPLEKITKEYPVRGPLSQFRFEKSISFNCFRCNESKTSKLITIYGNDWDKRLCNGCYGRLLSIYEIKSGQIVIDDKVSQLLNVLVKLVDESKIKAKSNRIYLQNNKSKYLSASALRFYATSECVAETLTKEPNLDWSAAIIGLCKAFELELIERFINPLRELCNSVLIDEADLKDKDFGRIASYCAGKIIKPPELGVIKHFISTAINSKIRLENSNFLRMGFKGFINKRANSNWLIDNNGLLKAIESLTNNYRNKAAHIDELEQSNYISCKELVFGDNGMMWNLILSTDIAL
ncbi:MAG: hypothetical protein IAE93_05880 [Ignavibacteria bacterium]|nr:hypothetical protein [Ignavibacteria bacterium]